MAGKLDNLINDIERHSENISISSVIQRHDGKVSLERITTFNNLTRNLCLKRKFHFIDNSDINKSFLNNSNFHRNITMEIEH